MAEIEAAALLQLFQPLHLMMLLLVLGENFLLMFVRLGRCRKLFATPH